MSIPLHIVHDGATDPESERPCDYGRTGEFWISRFVRIITSEKAVNGTNEQNSIITSRVLSDLKGPMVAQVKVQPKLAIEISVKAI